MLAYSIFKHRQYLDRKEKIDKNIEDNDTIRSHMLTLIEEDPNKFDIDKNLVKVWFMFQRVYPKICRVFVRVSMADMCKLYF